LTGCSVWRPGLSLCLQLCWMPDQFDQTAVLNQLWYSRMLSEDSQSRVCDVKTLSGFLQKVQNANEESGLARGHCGNAALLFLQ
jgi:hypothetical protein